MKKLLLVLAAIVCLAACDKSGESSGESSQLDEAVETIKERDPDKGEELSEAVDKVSQKTGRANLCELLDPGLVRGTFELSKDVELNVNDDEAICSYSWQQDDRTFKVGLNFSSSKVMNAAAAQKQWDSLKEMPTIQKNDIGPVNGVGEAAVWSKLGGGQLRVLAKGNIFYLSVSQKDPAWMKASMGLSGANGMTKEEAQAQKEKARDASKARAVALAGEIAGRL